MKLGKILAALVSISILASPALAGNRNDKNEQNKKMCRGKVAAKHIAAANKQAEMDKCMDGPDAY